MFTDMGVLTPASIVLREVKEKGGRTVIKREGIGIVARAYEGTGERIFESPASYCPVCAVLIGATRETEIAERVKKRMQDKPNTGRVKYEAGVENQYAMKNGKAFVTIKQGEKILADNVFHPFLSPLKVLCHLLSTQFFRYHP